MQQTDINQKEILREIRNYLAGRVEGITRDELLLEEVLKCTITKIKLDQNNIKLENENLAVRYHQLFREIVKTFPNLFKTPEILLGIKDVLFLHNKLSLINLNEMPRDFFGDAYETFIGNSYRGQEGQFFTPLNAVDLLINMTNPTSNDIILDPACGAGGFLVSSLMYIKAKEKKINNNIFGVDKDQFLTEMCKVRLATQFNTTFSILCADSLNGETTFKSLLKNTDKLFSLILTNPPFGSKIVSLAEENKHKFSLAYKWRWDKKAERFIRTDKLAKNVSPQVLFLERCISLLEKNGRLGIVLPESVISSPKYKFVVQHILDNCEPLAIIGMPESLFKTSGKGGTHTKVCLVVLRKSNPTPEHEIFMAEAKWCGHDSRGRIIPNDDLPQIYENYLNIQKNKKTTLSYLIQLKKIKDYILAPKYYLTDRDDAFLGLKKTHDLIKVKDLIEKGHLLISNGDEIGKLSYGTGNIPFVRTSDISNWEIKSDPKHLVDESVYNKYKVRQDVREGDILMVRDGTYLIGTCAMITSLDIKILYQSHLYKFRVLPTAPFDSYLLLALLSSSAVQSQIKSQSFTQDIINSLGKRIEEIIIPFPISDNVRRKISDQVKDIIEKKVKTKQAFNTLNNLLPNFSDQDFE